MADSMYDIVTHRFRVLAGQTINKQSQRGTEAGRARGRP
jgi:hypothetical protein